LKVFDGQRFTAAHWSWLIQRSRLQPVKAKSPPRRTPPESGVALFHRTAVAYGGTNFDPAVEGLRESSWIAQGMRHGLIRKFRAANPYIKSFLYKEGIFSDSHSSGSGSDPSNPSGVSYQSAMAHHSDWFLRDASGNLITRDGHPSYHLMDIGNRDYQNAWARTAISEAHKYGWTGVFADDFALDLYSTSTRRFPTGSPRFNRSWRTSGPNFGPPSSS
jgi:hypothetical protein